MPDVYTAMVQTHCSLKGGVSWQQRELLGAAGWKMHLHLAPAALPSSALHSTTLHHCPQGTWLKTSGTQVACGLLTLDVALPLIPQSRCPFERFLKAGTSGCIHSSVHGVRYHISKGVRLNLAILLTH